jgi:hypothetical protein
MLGIVYLVSFVLSVTNNPYMLSVHYAECHYTEFIVPVRHLIFDGKARSLPKSLDGSIQVGYSH